MVKKRRWSDSDLKKVVKKSLSIRSVIQKLGLVPAGGNYVQIKSRIKELNIDCSHFNGKGWRKGLKIPTCPAIPIEDILVKNGNFQSYKLKKRLFVEGFKKPKCEICGWDSKRNDGTIPVELDHINGDKKDNRLKNLRVLCPNCHSLQDTHRGKNIGRMPR